MRKSIWKVSLAASLFVYFIGLFAFVMVENATAQIEMPLEMPPIREARYYIDQPLRQWRGKDARVTGYYGRLHLFDGIFVQFRNRMSETDQLGMIRYEDLHPEDKEYLLQVPGFTVIDLFGSKVNEMAESQPIQFASNPVSLSSRQWLFEPQPIPDLEGIVAKRFTGRLTLGPPKMPRPLNLNPEENIRRRQIEQAESRDNLERRIKTIDVAKDGKTLAMVYQNRAQNVGAEAYHIETGISQLAPAGKSLLAVSAHQRTIAQLAEVLDKDNDKNAKPKIVLQVVSEGTGVQFHAPMAQLGRTPPTHGVFVNEQILLVAGSKITVMQLDSGRGYQSPDNMPTVNHIAVSPDRAHVALAIANGVLVFNPNTGKTAGFLSMAKAGPTIACFSPDGTHLLATGESDTALQVFDLRLGQLLKKIETTKKPIMQLAWPHERLAMVDGRFLIDLHSGVPVWQVSSNNGGEFFTHHLRKDMFLYRFLRGIHHGVIELPLAEIAARLEKIDWEQATAFEPGTKVSLDLSGLPAGNKQLEAVRSRLTAGLARCGLEVVSNAPNVLRASTERLAGETIRIDSFSGNSSPQSVTIRPNRSSIELVKNNQVIWRMTEENRPRGVPVRPGESLEMAANRQCLPRPEFFDFPFWNRVVLLSNNEPYLGSTDLTPTDSDDR